MYIMHYKAKLENVVTLKSAIDDFRSHRCSVSPSTLDKWHPSVQT